MRQVTAPDGKRWVVRRHWLARLPVWIGPRPRAAGSRRKGPRGEKTSMALDVAADSWWWIGAEAPGAVLIGIALVALVIIMVPVLIFLVDALLIGLAAMLLLLARVAFRRPWAIIAETPGPPAAVHRWKVAGWRASGEHIDRVADLLAAGSPPPA